MKVAKGAALLIACLAIVFSLAPVVAHALTPQNQVGPVPTDGGGASWTVTCSYDAQERLISKSCTSGGSSSCSCP